MEKFVHKPTVVEALQLTRKFPEFAIDWIKSGGGEIADYNLGEFSEDSCFIEIKKHDGVTTVEEGDYIIKGVKGEFYPCEESVFYAIYESKE